MVERKPEASANMINIPALSGRYIPKQVIPGSVERFGSLGTEEINGIIEKNSYPGPVVLGGDHRRATGGTKDAQKTS